MDGGGRERNREKTSMREEKSISWNPAQSLSLAPKKTLSIYFPYRSRNKFTAGESTYNLGRRLLIQSGKRGNE